MRVENRHRSRRLWTNSPHGMSLPFLVLVVLLCTLPWILYGPTVGRVWAKTGLVTLVAACPCPLVISTPVTYVSGLTHAARHGIIVKGGAVLEVRFLLENTSCKLLTLSIDDRHSPFIKRIKMQLKIALLWEIRPNCRMLLTRFRILLTVLRQPTVRKIFPRLPLSQKDASGH